MATIVCALCLPAMSLSAQDTDVPIEVVAVMNSLRTHGHAGNAERLLRQEDGPVDRRLLDELADSLAAFVIESESLEPGNRASGEALNALAVAGWKGRTGRPYDGAGPRLVRIAERVPALSVYALYSVSRLADEDEAMATLVAFGSSMRPAAFRAIHVLADMMGPEAIAVARDLFERDVIREPSARQMILTLARARGWARDGSTEPGTNHVALVMWQLRTSGGVGNAVRVLRQVDSTHTRQLLDELADSLTAFVVQQDAREGPHATMSLAMSALGQAGAAADSGVPYAGAADRLVRIAKTTGYAGAALSLLSRLHDQTEAVRRLREMAVAESDLAFTAVSQLNHCCGDAGVTALRDMFRVQSVTSPKAKELLNRFALMHGWRKASLPFTVAVDSSAAPAN